ncbi:hypothetical protein HMI54_012590 [Coelomomyces lativittatus]|nr:hypothetical protein HMI54_012590 [Coelomomyces lativittatus]KAJ1501570.1 hypothetical protein HMI55_003325 [Coelomomyces lativittatus]
MRKHNTVIHSPFRTQLPSTGLPSFGPIPETSEDVLKYIHHLGEVIQANQKLLQDAVDKLQVLMLTSTSGST